MELLNQQKLAKHIFRLLKVNEIAFPIGRTNKGNLSLRFSDTSEDFEIMLDSVPLSFNDFLKDENNIELKRMIEKYWFDGRSGLEKQMVKTAIQDNPLLTEIAVTEVLEVNKGAPLKRKGRPAGSKNKTKEKI